MTIAILTEKPSAARNFATALGGKSGNYNGEDFVIVNARGHLVELRDPNDPKMLVNSADVDRKKSWSLENLPWSADDFTWDLKPRGKVDAELKALKAAFAKVDEIAVASDLDPTGEGTALAGYIIQYLGMEGKKLTRMEFLDETPTSIQKAFTGRRPFANLEAEGDFRKARFRNKFDWLSMQSTRVATRCAQLQDEKGNGVVLRQGRLKSAMVVLVGDGLKAYNEYVRKPFYENRFRDENGVVYTNPDEDRFDDKAAVPAQYSQSNVIKDSATEKRTAPRRLIDLASLSAMLSAKGVKADQVLKVYQAMYEYRGDGGRNDGSNAGGAGLVSYPRTDDRVISTEQFNEMLPLVDSIAGVAGVNVGHLTHRTPRSTHVKNGGAHGANRPGTVVPVSLDWIKGQFGATGALIYETVALSFLAMFAEDYVYEQQKGHLETYPTFVGSANVPKSMGWKIVFNDSDDTDADENAQGLGQLADPFVHEGANTRPPHPTMKWLMTQLSKRDVGTGATRTSIYADVTSEKGNWPLMQEKRGKITMTDHGAASYLMLKDTKIGDLTATEQVYAIMNDIEAGKTTEDEHLGLMQDWITHDLEVMKRNAGTMRKELGLPDAPVISERERASGIFVPTGEEKSFNRLWGANEHWEGKRFDDNEVEALLRGEAIQFKATSKAGKPYEANGKLEQGTFKGRPTFGFKLDFGDPNKLPKSFCGREFSDDERTRIEGGEAMFLKGFTSKSNNPFDATLSFVKKKGGPGKEIKLEFASKKK